MNCDDVSLRSEEEIRDRKQMSEEKNTGETPQFEGAIDGFSMVLDNMSDKQSILTELERIDGKLSMYYGLYRVFKAIPFIGPTIKQKAWYYDGYQKALLFVFDAYLTGESDDERQLISHNSEEPIHTF